MTSVRQLNKKAVRADCTRNAYMSMYAALSSVIFITMFHSSCVIKDGVSTHKGTNNSDSLLLLLNHSTTSLSLLRK